LVSGHTEQITESPLCGLKLHNNNSKHSLIVFKATKTWESKMLLSCIWRNWMVIVEILLQSSVGL